MQLALGSPVAQCTYRAVIPASVSLNGMNDKRAGNPWNVGGALFKHRGSGDNSGGSSPTVFMERVDILCSVLLSVAVIIQTLNSNPLTFLLGCQPWLSTHSFSSTLELCIRLRLCP